MLKNEIENTRNESAGGLAMALIVAVMVYNLLCTTGCSFKIETGYHGLTGRDDRTQTQLVQEYKKTNTRN